MPGLQVLTMILRMRTVFAWLLLGGIGAVVAFWLSAGETPAVTTLHLGQQVSAGVPERLRRGQEQPVWLALHSDRILRVLTTRYGVEAHIPAGETNYEASFPETPQGIFQKAGERIFAGADVPILVAAPRDADQFRVKIVLEEYGAFYSGFQGWASGSSAEPSYTQRLREKLLGADHRGTTTTVWSPWLVWTNQQWRER